MCQERDTSNDYHRMPEGHLPATRAEIVAAFNSLRALIAAAKETDLHHSSNQVPS